MSKTVVLPFDSFTYANDYAVQFESVSLELTDEFYSVYADALYSLRVLKASPNFAYIAIDDTCFNWYVDDSFEGKARYGVIHVFHAGAAYFVFANDWTGDEYECEIPRNQLISEGE